MNRTIKLKWYCGYFVGDAKWRGDYYEPDECGTEFESDVDYAEWVSGDARAVCPRCHAELNQSEDEPEALYIPLSSNGKTLLC